MVIHAVYSDGVFRPLDAVELPEGRQVEVLIQTDPTEAVAVGTPTGTSPTSHSESRLLEAINQGLSESDWNYYHALIVKRQQETLTPEELIELSALSERIENLNVRRLECLSELAILRETTLPLLMDQLGLAPPQVL